MSIAGKIGLGALAFLSVVGCGSKSGDTAASGSSAAKSGGSAVAKTSGSNAPQASGSNSPTAAGEKARVPHDMKSTDLCLHSDPEQGSGFLASEEVMWKNGSTIKVGFLDGRPEQIEMVQQMADEWSNYANIKFDWDKTPNPKPKDGEFDELVTFDTAKCETPDPQWYAMKGTYGPKVAHHGQHSVCLSGYDAEWNGGAKDHVKASIKHEFGHVLGLEHEQFNPNLHVNWDKDYVYEWCAKTQNWDKAKCDAQVMESIVRLQPTHHWRASPFDKDSIMFYGIQDPNFTKERVIMPQPLSISEMDKKGVADMYPKSATEEPPAEAAKYDLESLVEKRKTNGDETVYAMAVGVAEASDRTKVDSVVYIFPPVIAPHPVEGDKNDKSGQFPVKGKMSVPSNATAFKVTAHIKMKDGSIVTVQKKIDLTGTAGKVPDDASDPD